MERVYVIEMGCRDPISDGYESDKEYRLGYVKSYNEACEIVDNIPLKKLIKRTKPQCPDEYIDEIIKDGRWCDETMYKDEEKGAYYIMFYSDISYYISCYSLDLFEKGSL